MTPREVEEHARRLLGGGLTRAAVADVTTLPLRRVFELAEDRIACLRAWAVHQLEVAEAAEREAGQRAQLLRRRLRELDGERVVDVGPPPECPPGGQVVRTRKGWRVFTAEAVERRREGSRRRWARVSSS